VQVVRHRKCQKWKPDPDHFKGHWTWTCGVLTWSCFGLWKLGGRQGNQMPRSRIRVLQRKAEMTHLLGARFCSQLQILARRRSPHKRNQWRESIPGGIWCRWREHKIAQECVYCVLQTQTVLAPLSQAIVEVRRPFAYARAVIDNYEESSTWIADPEILLLLPLLPPVTQLLVLFRKLQLISTW
jgi:hypothetical protein